MKEFNKVDDILDFAMEQEQEAVDFYTKLAEQSDNEEMREVFENFAQEEVGHKAKIKRVKEEGTFVLSTEKVKDLKISDYTINVKPTPNMTYQDALVVAMNKEKAAYKLYTKLAERADDKASKELFEQLAIEESKHKLRFEIEYDDYVLREN